MLRHVPLVLALLASPTLAQDLATGDTIKAALTDKTVQGTIVSSGAYTEFYAADGTIKGKDYIAKWTVEGDTMCFTYEGAAAECMHVKIAGNAVIWVMGGVEIGTGTIQSVNSSSYELSLLDLAFTQLSQSQRKQIQSNLSKLGLYASTVDGVYGRGTSAALTAYNKQYLSGSDLTNSDNVGNLISSVLKLESEPPQLTASGTLPKCPDDPNTGWTNCVGTLTSPDGDKYVGEFKDDEYDGQGTYTFPSGAKYVGEYKDGKKDGQGTFTWPDGAKYVGEYKNGSANGKGTHTLPNGNKHVGEYKDDKRNGQGTFTMPDGTKYIGGWKDDQPNGQGTWTKPDGSEYVGEFKNSLPNGQGTLTYSDGTVKEGIWENGQLKYPEAVEPPLVTEAKPQDNEVLEAASGSGFAVSSDGYVITNNHVIEGCQEVAIHVNGKAIPVTVVTYDLQNDLALLKGDFTPQTVFALSSDQPELLQDVYVAGYPFGNAISSSIKATKGIVSSLTGIGNNFSNIQIDAALQPGNSGGPILDEMGNVIGVAVSKLDAAYMLKNYGDIPENTNFGIKASVVRSVLDSNGVSSPASSHAEITKSELGAMISGGTFYVSCLMTMAQIEQLRTKKVMFENLE